MPVYQPICLEVSCSDIIRSEDDPRIYTVVFTADGGHETAYYDSDSETNYSIKTYTCVDITTNMYFSNRDNYIWKVNLIVLPCLEASSYTQATVELLDIGAYNSLANPSEALSAGEPLAGVIGYIYSLNSSGLPLINDIPNPPSENWLTSIISRHLMYSTGGSGGQGVPPGGSANQVLAKIDDTDYNTQWITLSGGGGGGTQGDTGATGFTGKTGATGATGATGNQGATGTTGTTGTQGATGATGSSGQGIPVGGSQNQVLAKINATDYNTQWITISGGGGGATGDTGFTGESGVGTALTENFIIIGSPGGYLYYSYNGIHWFKTQDKVLGDYGACRAIAWNGYLWLAGSTPSSGTQVNQIVYSSNGINWVPSTSANNLIDTCSSIASNGYLWVAGAPGGTNRIIYSSDGINWVPSTSANSLITACEAIASNGSLWVASGGSSTNKLIYSYDGINWLASTSANSLIAACNAIASNDYLWVAGASSGTNKIIYSYDGINWLASTSANSLITECNAIASNGYLWVAGGSGTNKLIYSYDGINWSAMESGQNFITSGSACSGISWNGSLWVAVFTAALKIIYSYNGKDWIDLDPTGEIPSKPYTVCSRRFISREFKAVGGLVTGSPGDTLFYVDTQLPFDTYNSVALAGFQASPGSNYITYAKPFVGGAPGVLEIETRYALALSSIIEWAVIPSVGMKSKIMPPVSNFTIQATGSAPPLYDWNNTLYFTNTSTNGYTYEWNFGDETTSTLENPSHKYTSARGDTDIILTVYDRIGRSNSKTVNITLATEGGGGGGGSGPLPPENLVATPTYNSIGLSWDEPASGGPYTYTVYGYGSDPQIGTPVEIFGPLPVEDILLTVGPEPIGTQDYTLLPEQTYWFSLVSVSGGSSSTPIYLETATLLPPQPTGFQAVPTYNSIELSWVAPDGEGLFTYIVLGYDSNPEVENPPTHIIGPLIPMNITGTSFTVGPPDYTLVPQGSYWFSLVNQIGDSTSTPIYLETTLPPESYTITSLTASNPALYDTRDDDNLVITNYTLFDITVIGPGNPGVDVEVLYGGGGGAYFSVIDRNTTDFDLSGLQITIIDGQVVVSTDVVTLMETSLGRNISSQIDPQYGNTISYSSLSSPNFGSTPTIKNGYNADGVSGGNAGNPGNINTTLMTAGTPGYGTNPNGTVSEDPGQGYGYGGGSSSPTPGGYYWRIIFHN